MKARVLFLIKRQLGYGGTPVPSKGLFNSAQFVVNALQSIGIEAHLAEVIDGNDIDRHVHNYRPTHCIIEALWATPKKMAEVVRLHRRVQFVVRIHSNVPFLATEGIAIEWLRTYRGVRIACNSLQAAKALSIIAPLDPQNCRAPIYLPNIYDPGVPPKQKTLDRKSPNVFVGCLGAIRPLKNQLQQAIAAIEFAELTNRKCFFHINGRVEQGGDQVLRNIRALFAGTKHRLIEHGWLSSHKEVLSVIASLDLSLQVSFTETFNIVSADAVWRGVPIVVSPEVTWAPERAMAPTNSVRKIVEVMKREERAGKVATRRNLHALLKHNDAAIEAWKKFLTRKVVHK